MRTKDICSAPAPGTHSSESTDAVQEPMAAQIGGVRSLLRAKTDGQSLVEFALVLPVLLLVLMGIFQFGIALNQYLVLTNAVNAGARAAALSRTSGQYASTPSGDQDPCKYAVTVIEAAAPNLNSGNLNFTITYTPGPTNPNVSDGATTYKPSSSPSSVCPKQVMATGDTVQVIAKYPVTPVIFGWSGSTLNLTAQSTELVN